MYVCVYMCVRERESTRECVWACACIYVRTLSPLESPSKLTLSMVDVWLVLCNPLVQAAANSASDDQVPEGPLVFQCNQCRRWGLHAGAPRFRGPFVPMRLDNLEQPCSASDRWFLCRAWDCP